MANGVISRGTSYIFGPYRMKMKRLHIGSDHAGFDLKEQLKLKFGAETEIIDHGCFSGESVDYPDYAHPLAVAVEEDGSMGILICGSANGVAMTANKHQGIRAAICWSEEIAKLARLHNDANVICIPARYVSEDISEMMIRVFINTAFEGGRHANRVSKIGCN